MRNSIPMLATLVLSACGGSNSSNDGGTGGMDYAPPYVGAWTGMATATANGNSITNTVEVPIEETGTNVIELQGFCADTDAYATGPMADVTSSGFTFRSDSCHWASADCTAGNLTFVVTSGSGTLSNGQLSFTFDGSVSCGSQTVTISLTYSASQKGAYGSSTASGHGFGSAIRSFQ